MKTLKGTLKNTRGEEVSVLVSLDEGSNRITIKAHGFFVLNYDPKTGVYRNSSTAPVGHPITGNARVLDCTPHD